MSDSELRSRLADKQGAWRELPDELRARGDLAERLAELESLAEADPEVDVRYKARKVLSALDAGRARSAVASKPAAPLGGLAAALAAVEPAERGPICENFAREHRAAAVDELVPLLRTETDPQQLSVVARLIGQFGNASHVRDLKPLLAHASPRVVANAVEAMGRCDAGSALPTVLPALMAEDHRVRANVLIVLYQASRDEVLGYLARMAASPHESYRAAAVWCLGQIKDPDGEPILLKILQDEDAEEIVEAASKMIEESGTAWALAPLKRLAGDRPDRAARAEKLLATIAGRLGMGPAQVAFAVGPTHNSTGGRAAAKISRQIRRISGSFRRGIHKGAVALKTSGAHLTIRARKNRRRTVTMIVLSCMAVLLVYVYRGPLTGHPTPRWTVLGSQGPVASRSSGAPRSSKAPLKLVGLVSARMGSTVVMKKDYTLYAVRFRDSRLLAKITAGQTIAVNARFRAWNSSQGYVEMDATSAPVKP